MNLKSFIKILIVLLVFILIEFLRLGYMRKDNAREVENQSKFYNMEQRIEEDRYGKPILKTINEIIKVVENGVD